MRQSQDSPISYGYPYFNYSSWDAGRKPARDVPNTVLPHRDKGHLSADDFRAIGLFGDSFCNCFRRIRVYDQVTGDPVRRSLLPNGPKGAHQ